MSENFNLSKSNSPESLKIKEQLSIKEKILKRLETSMNNPISESRLIELENQLQQINDRFVDTGHREISEIAEENKIEEEILRSSAIADNLPEFQEMLGQLSERFGKEHKWKEKYLAHENSHANVSEQTQHEWVGYGVFFIKDEKGNLSSVQPLHFSKPQMNWGPREVLEKRIQVTEAPREYGDKMSDSDIASVAEDTERLNKISQKEKETELKILEIRKKLGILSEGEGLEQ